MKKTLGLLTICVIVALGSIPLISAVTNHFSISNEIERFHISDLYDCERELIYQFLKENGGEFTSPYFYLGTTIIWCGSDNCFCCDFERDLKTRIQSRLGDLGEIERVYFANPLW